MVSKSGDEIVFKDGEVESSIGGCRGSAHGSTTELKPVGITKLEEIVSHDESEGSHEFSNRDSIEVLPLEISGDGAEGFGCGDVGIHRDGVSSEDIGIRGQLSKGEEFLFQRIRVLEIGALLLGDLLKLVVNPDAKSIEQAATAGDYGTALEWAFVNFHSEIESGEGVLVIVKMMTKELPFILKKDPASAGIFYPLIELAANDGHMAGGIGWGHKLVGVRVAQVVSEGHLDVAMFFNDGRAKILIALNNEIVLLVAEIGQGALLMRQEVTGAATFDELLFQRRFEVVSAFDNIGWGGFLVGRNPGGSDIHTGVVVARGAGFTSHPDLDIKVAIKAGPGSCFELVPRSRIPAGRNELEAEPKQGTKIRHGWFRQSEIMKGHVGGFIEVCKRGHGGQYKICIVTG